MPPSPFPLSRNRPLPPPSPLPSRAVTGPPPHPYRNRRSRACARTERVGIGRGSPGERQLTLEPLYRPFYHFAIIFTLETRRKYHGPTPLFLPPSRPPVPDLLTSSCSYQSNPPPLHPLHPATWPKNGGREGCGQHFLVFLSRGSRTANNKKVCYVTP